MKRRMLRFLAGEAGAVTADWVVLTAGIVLAVWAGLLMIRGRAIDVIVTIFDWVTSAALL